jgi:hypothetical protein
MSTRYMCIKDKNTNCKIKKKVKTRVYYSDNLLKQFLKMFLDIKMLVAGLKE